MRTNTNRQYGHENLCSSLPAKSISLSCFAIDPAGLSVNSLCVCTSKHSAFSNPGCNK